MIGRACGVHNETSVMCIVNIFVCLAVCVLFSVSIEVSVNPHD